MLFANYFFASIISFLGLVIGFMLVKIAPEEQKPLMKYFSFAKKFFLLLIFIFLLFYYSYSSAYIIGLVALCLFLLYIDHAMKDSSKKSMIVYSIFGILFFLSSKNTNLFVFVSSLILVYGMFAPSMLQLKPKIYEKFLAGNSVFILIANILFFL
jgi:hypothetical protein